MDRASRIDQALNLYASQNPPPPVEEFCARHRDLLPELRERLGQFCEPATLAHAARPTEREGCLTAEELDEYRNASFSTIRGIHLAGHVAACNTCHQALIRARQTTRTTSDPPKPRVPDHIVERWIGGGGFGNVFSGRHERLWQDRAFKVLKTKHLGPAEREREMREARLMASLPAHANRVQVHDLIEKDGEVIVVMDYIAGGPLSKRAPMDWEPALRYLIGTCEGLLELHERGIIHRDLKPPNLLWDTARDSAVVADYGLATLVDENVALAGTAGYLAPELIDQPASVRTDVFALGCTLYALLTGASPFSMYDPYLGLRQAEQGVAPEALAKFPAGVRRVLSRSLEPDPARRPDLPGLLALLRLAHVGELAEILDRRVKTSRASAHLNVTVSVARDAQSSFEERLRLGSGESNGCLEVVPGQIIEFTAATNQVGHLTMLNFDTAGSLDVLIPGVLSQTTRIEPGKPHRISVQLTPSPAGDRTAIIWTPDPLPDSPEAWRKRLAAESESATKGPTRGVKLVGHWIDESQWATVLIDVVQPGTTTFGSIR